MKQPNEDLFVTLVTIFVVVTLSGLIYLRLSGKI